MKNFIIIAYAVTFLLITSCSQDENNNFQPENIKSEVVDFETAQRGGYDTKILDDEIFKEFLISEYDALQQLNIDEISKYEGLEITENNYDEIVLALGFDSRIQYKEFHVRQYERLMYLDNEYSFLSHPTDVKELIIKDGYININYPQSWPDPTTIESCSGDKWWCDAGVIAAAVIVHAGCAAMEVETVGIGLIFGCHTAAGVAQAIGHRECIKSYNECIKDEK